MTAPVTLVQHAMRLLTMRPHSEAEITRKLMTVCRRRKNAKRAATAEEYASVDCSVAVSEVIKLCKSYDILNDKEYAEWHVENRVNFRPRSRVQLVGELRAKSISTDVIQHTLSETRGLFDDVDACVAMLRRRLHKSRDEQLKFLARKGFHLNIIKQAMQRVKEDSEFKEAEASVTGDAKEELR